MDYWEDQFEEPHKNEEYEGKKISIKPINHGKNKSKIMSNSEFEYLAPSSIDSGNMLVDDRSSDQ